MTPRIIIAASVAAATLFFTALPAMAAAGAVPDPAGINIAAVGSVRLALDTTGSSVSHSRKLTNPLGEGTTIQTLIGRAINIFTGVSGSVALLMFVYGGFLWLTSGGSTDKIAKGKKVFMWSTVGLLIIFGSYAILRALFQALGVGL